MQPTLLINYGGLQIDNLEVSELVKELRAYGAVISVNGEVVSEMEIRNSNTNEIYAQGPAAVIAFLKGYKCMAEAVRQFVS